MPINLLKYDFFCREQRLIDASRFRTRTISREDIVGSGGNSPQQSPSSPKTLKQRRADDVDRYRTQTISNTSLVGGLNLLPGSELGVPASDPIGPMSPQVYSTLINSLDKKTIFGPGRFVDVSAFFVFSQ